MFEDLQIQWAAATLASWATADQVGQHDVFDLLGNFDAAQRGQIAAKAVQLGGDPTVIDLYLKMFEGEVIEVKSRVPRWWLGGAVVAAAIAAAGAYSFYRGRRA